MLSARLKAETRIAKDFMNVARDPKQELDFATLQRILVSAGDLQRLDASGESGYLKSQSDRPGLSGMGNPTRRSATLTGDPKELDKLPDTDDVFRPKSGRVRFRDTPTGGK